MSAAERDLVRYAIGAVMMAPEDTWSDNLAIALCTYYSDHPRRPKNDPINENGWGEWVASMTNTTLDRIAAVVCTAPERETVTREGA